METKITKEEFLNLPTGKTFKVGINTLIVSKETEICKGCFFNNRNTSCRYLQKKGVVPLCDRLDRIDRENKIFCEVK